MNCQGHRCRVEVTDRFLCRTCTSALADLLRDIPWFLDRLAEAAVGQTRLSEPGAGRGTQRDILHGDTPLVACLGLLPEADDLERARRDRHRRALANALRLGGCNMQASELLAEIGDSLAYWCSTLCEDRGLTYTPMHSPGRRLTLGAEHAIWLKRHIESIAQFDCAGDIAMDVWGHRRDIERAINQPMVMVQLGTCPVDILTTGEVMSTCGARLRAPAGAETTYCRRCFTTHSVSRLLMEQMDAAGRQPLTAKRLLAVNRQMPAHWQVPESTVRWWISQGVLASVGAVDGAAVYLWADLVKLRTGEKVTG